MSRRGRALRLNQWPHDYPRQHRVPQSVLQAILAATNIAGDGIVVLEEAMIRLPAGDDGLLTGDGDDPLRLARPMPGRSIRSNSKVRVMRVLNRKPPIKRSFWWRVCVKEPMSWSST